MLTQLQHMAWSFLQLVLDRLACRMLRERRMSPHPRATSASMPPSSSCTLPQHRLFRVLQRRCAECPGPGPCPGSGCSKSSFAQMQQPHLDRQLGGTSCGCKGGKRLSAGLQLSRPHGSLGPAS